MNNRMITLAAAFFFMTSIAMGAQSFFELKTKDIDGKEVLMSKYEGKVILVVNTASQCGFTPQLKDLEELNKKYASQGLVILGFPSNDFKQDPGTSQDIQEFAKKNYNITFPLMEKAPVTGKNKQPIYQFLTDQKSGILFKDVSWNFEKFLVNRQGQVVDRWNSTKSPTSSDVVSLIEKSLADKTLQSPTTSSSKK